MSGSCPPVEESSTTAPQTDDFSQTEGPGSVFENTVNTNSHALVPTAQSQRYYPLLIPKYVFDQRLRRRFKLIGTGEVLWNEPWYTLVYRLFSGEGYDVTLAHWMEGDELTVHYIVRLYEGTVACVIDIKSGSCYESARHRVQAYQQLKNRLLKHTKDDVGANGVDVVYGLQCLGDRFMVMRMNPKQRLVTPVLHTHLRHTNFAEMAPKRWWCHKLNKRRGRERLIDLANDIRLMLRMFQPVEQTRSPLSEDSCGGNLKESDVSFMLTHDNRLNIECRD